MTASGHVRSGHVERDEGLISLEGHLEGCCSFMVALVAGSKGNRRVGRSATRGGSGLVAAAKQKQPAQHGIRPARSLEQGLLQPRPDRGIERCLRDDGSMRPVIGLTAYVEPARWVAWEDRCRAAARLVSRGGDPFRDSQVMLPPQQEAAVALASRPTLILTGGPDISATMYGQDPHPTNDRPRHLRDEFEVAMYRAVREAAGKPVLGVCRGLQIMAVAEGGYLTQHLPDVTDLPHREKVGAFTEHGAMFAPDSIAHRLLGAEMTVNSSHHQAVGDPGGFLSLAAPRTAPSRSAKRLAMSS